MEQQETEETYHVRPATGDDVHDILACLTASFEPFRDFYSDAAFRDTVPSPELIATRLAFMKVFVTTDGAGNIVGTAGVALMDEVEAHIRGMAVLPGLQGRGIARRLLDRIESEVKACGRSRITLDTTRPLVRAISLYERSGFVRTGRIQDYFGMELIEFVKELSP